MISWNHFFGSRGGGRGVEAGLLGLYTIGYENLEGALCRQIKKINGNPGTFDLEVKTESSKSLGLRTKGWKPLFAPEGI